MFILGLESSCDETGVGIVEVPGFKIHANVLSTQIDLHAPYFGVVPELASRAHLEKIVPVFETALSRSKVPLEDIAAISYTRGPGLKGSLLIGEMTAKALAFLLGKPVVGVNHLEAHLSTILFDYPRLRPPFLGLVVSGGHTDLVIVKDWGNYKVLGRTLDDACGEAFDKFAKMLKLGYPGGPFVDQLSKKGDSKKVSFPRPTLDGTWDFSFSGLKTSALYWLRDNKLENARRSTHDAVRIEDLTASFQEAICETLCIKATRALKHFDLKTLVVCGGVAANSRLRFLLPDAFFPRVSHCTDNGAMVALLGGLRLLKRGKSLLDREFQKSVDTSLALMKW